MEQVQYLRVMLARISPEKGVCVLPKRLLRRMMLGIIASISVIFPVIFLFILRVCCLSFYIFIPDSSSLSYSPFYVLYCALLSHVFVSYSIVKFILHTSTVLNICRGLFVSDIISAAYVMMALKDVLYILILLSVLRHLFFQINSFRRTEILASFIVYSLPAIKTFPWLVISAPKYLKWFSSSIVLEPSFNMHLIGSLDVINQQ